ncbi:hypothetical protein GH714_031985 [Hevea brasiliensis]|uniref:EamA domain-containing protein n=1 Tax=Hevea brasiliensis TaxID=3981 RepID=A0A6A6KBM2_HEVBR|nr:hypothetical protein GH714_031985 [Hevea brasiliensis]
MEKRQLFMLWAARSIPLFETAFTRCTIVLILSYVWLRRSGQPLFGAANARKLLFWRALTGYLSLLSFIYCIQRLPLSQAIVLNFTTPIVASIVARIMLREKFKIADIGGLACSFIGVVFIYRQILRTQGGWIRGGEKSNATAKGSHHIYAVLVGLFSSITGGISYCLIKAGAKASDQPVATFFHLAYSLALLREYVHLLLRFRFLKSEFLRFHNLSVFCCYILEEFVVPDFYSFTFMLILSVLAFFVEVFLARGFQLERTSRAANVQYIEVALSQLWGMSSSRASSPFGGLVGCLLILISVCCTIFWTLQRDGMTPKMT